MMLGPRWEVVAPFAASGVVFVLWARRERHTDQPLLETSVLTKPQVLLPIAGSGLAGYAAFSMFFLVPRSVQVPRCVAAHIARQLQYGFGADRAAVGLFLLPIGIDAQIAATFKSQGIAGSSTPHESVFVIAFGLCALLAAIGARLALIVPAGSGASAH